MAEIKAKSLARCLIVEIARLVCPVFKQFSIKNSNAQISIFWEHAPLVLQPQDSSFHSPLKNHGTDFISEIIQN